MRIPTAILQEQYEHRWQKEQERIIDRHRRARARDWAWLRWKHRLAWMGFTFLGASCFLLGLWLGK
jgi:hypothetical protein